MRKADNLTTILCRFHEHLGNLTSWNPLGHSRPVTGLIYFYPKVRGSKFLRNCVTYLPDCVTRHAVAGNDSSLSIWQRIRKADKNTKFSLFSLCVCHNGRLLWRRWMSERWRCSWGRWPSTTQTTSTAFHGFKCLAGTDNARSCSAVMLARVPWCVDIRIDELHATNKWRCLRTLHFHLWATLGLSSVNTFKWTLMASCKWGCIRQVFKDGYY